MLMPDCLWCGVGWGGYASPLPYMHENTKIYFLTTNLHMYTANGYGHGNPHLSLRGRALPDRGNLIAVTDALFCNGLRWCRITALRAENQSGLQRPHSQRALLYSQNPSSLQPQKRKILFLTRIFHVYTANGHGYGRRSRKDAGRLFHTYFTRNPVFRLS